MNTKQTNDFRCDVGWTDETRKVCVKGNGCAFKGNFYMKIWFPFAFEGEGVGWMRATLQGLSEKGPFKERISSL